MLLKCYVHISDKATNTISIFSLLLGQTMYKEHQTNLTNQFK